MGATHPIFTRLQWSRRVEDGQRQCSSARQLGVCGHQARRRRSWQRQRLRGRQVEGGLTRLAPHPPAQLGAREVPVDVCWLGRRCDHPKRYRRRRAGCTAGRCQGVCPRRGPCPHDQRLRDGRRGRRGDCHRRGRRCAPCSSRHRRGGCCRCCPGRRGPVAPHGDGYHQSYAEYDDADCGPPLPGHAPLVLPEPRSGRARSGTVAHAWSTFHENEGESPLGKTKNPACPGRFHPVGRRRLAG